MQTKEQLEARVRKLERALRFYANANNYGHDDWGVHCVIQGGEYGEPGKRARRALGKKALLGKTENNEVKK